MKKEGTFKQTFKQIGEGKSTLYAFRSTPRNDILIKNEKMDNPEKTTTEIINELLESVDKKQNKET